MVDCKMISKVIQNNSKKQILRNIDFNKIKDINLTLLDEELNIGNSLKEAAKSLKGLQKTLADSAKSRQYRKILQQYSYNTNKRLKKINYRPTFIFGTPNAFKQHNYIAITGVRPKQFIGIDYNAVNKFLKAARQPTSFFIDWTDICSFCRLIKPKKGNY